MSPSDAILTGGPFEPGAEEDPDFVYRIELLSGPEGEELEAQQMAALREFLIWARSELCADEEGEVTGHGTTE